MGKPLTPKKRIGRPPKAGVGKRGQFNTRLSNDLKQKLEAEAKDSGRSLSEEIETRLENSFRGWDAIAGGSKNASFFRILGFLFSGISSGTGAKSVWDRPQAFVEAADAMRAFFDSLAKGRRDLSKGATPTGLGAKMGDTAAQLFSDALALDYDDVIRRAEPLGGTRLEDG